jgi:hypothetical protein
MDNLKQNNRRREVIAQCFCIAKISCAVSIHWTQYWSKGKDKLERKQIED